MPSDLNYSIHRGDSGKILDDLEENSFDSCVTDPPAWIGFMGKGWDHEKGLKKSRVLLQSVRFVLKPGAHALVWALPRIAHKTATALEDAGFEIRDVLCHVQGQGFPKGRNVGKGIDKEKGAERKVVGHRKGQGNVPNDRGEWGYTPHAPVPVTVPATEESAEWEGWNTGLKPSHESWILCRKPLSEKTVAKNVLKWGVGGLNVAACRAGPPEKICTNGYAYTTERDARWPANLITTGELVDLPPWARFFFCPKVGNKERNFGCEGLPLGATKRHGARGQGALAKQTPQADVVENNTHPTVKPLELMRHLCRLITPPGGTVLDPYMGSGSTGVAALVEGFIFFGVEKEEEYFKIAQARISAAAQKGGAA